MKKTLLASTLILAAGSAFHGESYGAQDSVCGRLAGHDVAVPSGYSFSRALYANGNGRVSCKSEIKTLMLRPHREDISLTSLTSSKVDHRADYLITLQAKSTEPRISIGDTLSVIYNQSHHENGKLPYPMVKDGNGLIYIHGAPNPDEDHRSDIYLKPTASGDTEFMVYCDVAAGQLGKRNCLMGYTEDKLGLNVVIKIAQSEVGNYQVIMQTVRNSIEPIIKANNVE